MTSDEVDSALLRAWALFIDDPTDEVDDELERLLPKLVAAGYANVEDDRWSFTREGVARAEQLERDGS